MLKHLTLDEMVALLSPWLAKGRRHALFTSIPEVAPLHPQVVQAHAAVLAVRPADTTVSPAMRAVLLKGEQIDNQHDYLARLTTLTLQAERARCLSTDPPETARADRCAATDAKLLPGGLSIINASFLAESGNASRLAQLLEEEPELGQFLKTVATPDKKPLMATVEAWIATGPKLAAVEHEREELEAKKAAPADKATVQEARNRWFRIMTAVLNNLDISGAPAEDIEALRGPVLRASERAGKRYGSGQSETAVLDPEPADGAPPA